MLAICVLMYSVYLLYEYISTNTDTFGDASDLRSPRQNPASILQVKQVNRASRLFVLVKQVK
jgi:hypothetical protein